MSLGTVATAIVALFAVHLSQQTLSLQVQQEVDAEATKTSAYAAALTFWWTNEPADPASQSKFDTPTVHIQNANQAPIAVWLVFLPGVDDSNYLQFGSPADRNFFDAQLVSFSLPMGQVLPLPSISLGLVAPCTVEDQSDPFAGFDGAKGFANQGRPIGGLGSGVLFQDPNGKNWYRSYSGSLVDLTGKTLPQQEPSWLTSDQAALLFSVTLDQSPRVAPPVKATNSRPAPLCALAR